MVPWAVVTDSPGAFLAELPPVRAGAVRVDDPLDNPFALVGSAATLADRVRELRERVGVTYVTVFDGLRTVGFDRVVSAPAD